MASLLAASALGACLAKGWGPHRTLPAAPQPVVGCGQRACPHLSLPLCTLLAGPWPPGASPACPHLCSVVRPVALLSTRASVSLSVWAWRSPLTRHPQKKLSGHPNIVQFCSAASIGKEESDTGQAEFLLLTELCRGERPARRAAVRTALGSGAGRRGIPRPCPATRGSPCALAASVPSAGSPCLGRRRACTASVLGCRRLWGQQGLRDPCLE